MIRYSLVCAGRHEFEAWFGSSGAFDAQRAAGHVACPICGSLEVEKALMAPSITTGRKGSEGRAEQTSPAHGPDRKQMIEAMKKVRNQLIANADYVGDRFAEEARKIHYEEAEKRGIYGQATPEEARGLIEEGVSFAPLPVLPDDAN
ncbi:DUF1178 family protein [Faunimonas sp. B44]|uniref:DUF1178 family protein n=1 Tax=Faunimonas sp. B44 TaxID=3461493 RepID=UPI004044DD52